MRQSMLEVVRQDYVQTARAKGLSERVVISKHALRNALLPGGHDPRALALPGLIGGSVIIESIFAIPGMGQLMVQSVFSRDYPVVMGNLVIVATPHPGGQPRRRHHLRARGSAHPLRRAPAGSR